MLSWWNRQWNDIKGNVKFAGAMTLLSLAMAGVVRLTHGLTWLQQGGLVVIFFVVFLWAAIVTYIVTRGKPEAQKGIETRTDEAATISASDIPRTGSLTDRAASLAHELLSFLKEKGPKEDPHKYDLDEWMEVNGPRVEAIHHGYLARFNDRLERLVHELAEIGVRDPELNNSLINPQAQNEEKIRTIAEKLLLLRNRLEMRDYDVPADLPPKN